ncbi:hypothetical protein QAD02_003955 [Eretmocerus hayati]|uniref:Uncharacterized protein n=1 Tax=Eretmocerus hayati TaxID=131215 RepID=A0ACC2NNC7_9HYME|nr:hypothetical protein QAD02_003955 [Eretmocerus hayati]
MKSYLHKLVVVVLHLILFQPSICIRLSDFIPVKHDVTKVRYESQLRNVGDQYTVLDFIGLVQRHGYPAEEHYVMTHDGYILVMHRIPGSPSNPKSFEKPIVFLQHGLFLSSDTFVLLGPGKDLAFLLADAGYDVWFGNARGNTYSRYHASLSTEEKEFWQFSYHEIGLFDLSASIDYVLSTTGQPKLVFIGYSMGASEIFVLLSILPEYNRKITLIVCLAPIAFWRNRLPIGLQFLANNADAMEDLTNQYDYYEILPQSSYFARLSDNLCRNQNTRGGQLTCASLLYLTPIADVTRFNMTAYPTVLKYFPAGTSIQAVLHYTQNMVSGRFQAYDHGPLLNYEKYSRKTPPSYNLKQVTAPVAIFYGNNDYFTTPKNCEILRGALPNVVLFKKIPHDRFNHLDVLWAVDSKKLLYPDVLSIIGRYTNKYYRRHY